MQACRLRSHTVDVTPPQAATKIMAGMAEWRNGGMAEWRTEWRNGRKNGRMVEWREWLPTYYFWYTPTTPTPTPTLTPTQTPL